MNACDPRPRVYLAGPDVFFRDSAQIFQRLKQQCEALRMVGVEPSDGGLGDGFAGSDEALAQRIYEGNIALIREAEGCLWRAAQLRSPGSFQIEAAIQSAHCQRAFTGQVPWGSIALSRARRKWIASCHRRSRR